MVSRGISRLTKSKGPPSRFQGLPYRVPSHRDLNNCHFRGGFLILVLVKWALR